jgi:hypothetical protein
MSTQISNLSRVLVVSGLAVSLGSVTATAQKKYDIGVSDTEIKIGNVMPYSGPASAYAAIGKTEAAYFKMINEQGGVNGRKINFISSRLCTFLCGVTERLGESPQECGWNFHHVAVFPGH